MNPKRKPVKSCWAVIDDETGDIVMYQAGQSYFPMCSVDGAHVERFREWAQKLFDHYKRPLSLRRFEYTKDIETFKAPLTVVSEGTNEDNRNTT